MRPGQHGKSPAFVVLQRTPFNGGAPPADLGGTNITPTPAFYVRGHGPVPALGPEAGTLHVGGMVERPMSLRLEELKREFAQRTLEVTLQCAGNRRRELHEVKPMQANALLWATQAIGNATWTGVELGDVLRAAGVQPGAAHLAMSGNDLGAAPDGGGFGASIPLAKAMQPGTLLAWAMNGEPLPQIHGAPLRAIVPGFIAARSVKWLTHITVQDQPSSNHFQANDYKTFPPDVNEENVEWAAGTMLGHHATHGAILSPGEGDTVRAGRVRLRGYALAAGDAVITRVEVSLDGGATWQPGSFESPPRRWVWALWSADIDLPVGGHTLILRVHDSAGAVQPRRPADIWNFRGYQNNAWHWVRIQTERKSPGMRGPPVG